MKVEVQVAEYYTRGMLEEKIFRALEDAGKDLAQLETEDLAGIDDLHVGGRDTSDALAGIMGLKPRMRLLDVGSGLGGSARFFAERGCQVTGIDLSQDFVRAAEALTRMVHLEDRVRFLHASALEMPFDAATFDGAYMIHVGMNVADKAGVYREVARVLKPGGRFTVFDILGTNDGVDFPVPWSATPEASYIASLDDYRRALRSAGFRIDHERGRRQFAIDFGRRMMQRAASSPAPPLGLHVLMGEQAPVMFKNVNAAFLSGSLEPVEISAIKS